MYEVLIIDDNEINIDLCSIILKESGIKMHTTTSGFEGIGMAMGLMPDLILLDLYMPFMNGHEVVSHLKLNQMTKNIPIIIMSAEDKYLVERLGLDIVDIISKPLSVTELENKVLYYLKRQKSVC